MVVPAGAETFSEALRIGAEVVPPPEGGCSHERGLATGVGDEGGFAPDLALDRRRRSRRSSRPPSGPGTASRSRSRSTRRRASCTDDGALPARAARAATLDAVGDDRPLGRRSATAIPIVSIEDGLAEDDWDGWQALTDAARRPRRSSSATTSSSRTSSFLRRGIEEGVAQRDPRQGEPDRDADRDARRDRARAARAATRAVISHRSGETEDTTIADLAVADERRPDQDRRAVAHRPRREVQPAPADRGGAGRRGRRIPAGPRSRAPAAEPPPRR